MAYYRVYYSKIISWWVSGYYTTYYMTEERPDNPNIMNNYKNTIQNHPNVLPRIFGTSSGNNARNRLRSTNLRWSYKWKRWSTVQKRFEYGGRQIIIGMILGTVGAPEYVPDGLTTVLDGMEEYYNHLDEIDPDWRNWQGDPVFP